VHSLLKYPVTEIQLYTSLIHANNNAADSWLALCPFLMFDPHPSFAVYER